MLLSLKRDNNMRLHFEDEENTEEEPGGDIPGLCFVIAFHDFFTSTGKVL